MWQEAEQSNKSLEASDVFGKLAQEKERNENKSAPALDSVTISDTINDAVHRGYSGKLDESTVSPADRRGGTSNSRRISAFKMAPSVSHFRIKVLEYQTPVTIDSLLCQPIVVP